MKYITNKNFNAVIVFKDGQVIFAKSCGALGEIAAELCFSTAHSGYQESISDPSYAGQAIIFSFPHIGNVGTNIKDVESGSTGAKAIILNEKPTNASNYRSENEFMEWLKKNNILALYDVDSRALIQKLKKEGAQNVAIGCYKEGVEVNIESLQNLAINYSYDFKSLMEVFLNDSHRNKLIQEIIKDSQANSTKIIAFDYGIKLNILRCLADSGFNITLLPYNCDANKINFNEFSGIVFSNGPADPAEAFEDSKELVSKAFASKLPILGICLGHQIIGYAHEKLKMTVIKMPQGHRGINHPIKNLLTNIVEITSQNHGFALIANNNEQLAYISHRSLFDDSVAGLYLPEEKIITIQYHPESSPGTHDSRYLFENFAKMVKKG